MPTNLLQAGRQAIIKTPFGGENAAVLTRFTAIERLSEPFTIIAEVIITKGEGTLRDHLGAPISIDVQAGAGRSRFFHGRLWEILELDDDGAGTHYRLTLRPFASFLDINIESRMYQNMKVDDIAKDVMSRRSGVGPKLRFELGNTVPALEYCVQWQESDFDFISRLFERHGIYYYFQHAAGEHAMVATDQKSHHTAIAGVASNIEVRPVAECIGRPGGSVWNLSKRFEVAPLKATVTDYDFLTPANNLNASRTAARIGADAELYVHPGGFTKATGDGRGPSISEHLVEAARAEAERCSAEGDVFAAAVGRTIEIKAGAGQPAVKYLIVATAHVYTGARYRSGAGDDDELTVQMELIPASVQFRPPMKTPRPRIYGPQTAVVVGAGGEEIETDKHGRIKVHFHWDRESKRDSNSSCWIRVAQSMAGPQWGGFVLPRIGQEVVVEFLNGDPDAPLVTGAVYNGANAPPYELPANKTRSTFKSRSSKNSKGFNELRFEDKAGSEEVFFHAEKDLNSIVDKGHETRTLNSGNRTTTISKGDETLEITKGKRTQTIEGDETLTIQSGNRKEEISQGNDDLTIKMGNRTIKLKMGKHSTDAMQGIELVCGKSTITMTPASIEIKSVTIKIEATLALQTKGLMVQQEASALHVIKGAMVLIN